MKKLIFLFAGLLFMRDLRGQITQSATFTNPNSSNLNPPHLDKFHVSGYKYVYIDYGSLQISIFNTNLSVFKTISVPGTLGGIALTSTNYHIDCLSENLFDLDNLMEYVVSLRTTPTGAYMARTYILKETGAQLFMRDSASLSSYQNYYEDIFHNNDVIHFNGINPVMILRKTPYSGGIPTFLFYDLPGTIPCAQCGTTGTVTGKPSIQPSPTGGAVFYPNPVTDQLKLKYQLPKDYKNAQIQIYDLQGKLIETFKVTDTFDFIYLPTDYNNGLYLYSLNVDGKIIKTEKILLDK